MNKKTITVDMTALEGVVIAHKALQEVLARINWAQNTQTTEATWNIDDGECSIVVTALTDAEATADEEGDFYAIRMFYVPSNGDGMGNHDGFRWLRVDVDMADDGFGSSPIYRDCYGQFDVWS